MAVTRCRNLLSLMAAVVTALASVVLPLTRPVAAAAATANVASAGYWMVTSNGGVLAFGGVPLKGADTDLGTVVGMARTTDSGGYWLASSAGAVAALGDATGYGSVTSSHITLAKPIVGMAATPDGKGYWLVASDGGIFTFGDATFYGSTGAITLNQPVVGMAPTPDGRGYWLVASDGGIFTFGDATFYGSMGAVPLNKPVVGMAATTDGRGYWLVASDGGIFTFGDAPFYGSTGAIRLNRPVVAMAATPDSAGYWLAASDGGIFTFGDAPFRGSAGGTPLLHPVVGFAEGAGSGTGVVAAANAGLGPYPSGATGYDISWPQCGGSYPGGTFQIGIVGVNDGHAFSTNPCLTSEAAWGGAGHELYVNTNSPNGSSYNEGASGPAGTCSTSDANCWSYNYGWNAAQASYNTVAADGVMSQQWWLDVETGNYWSGNTAANTQVIKGFIDFLRAQGLSVGVYSTSYQWGVITGGASFGVPVWYPTGLDISQVTPSNYCPDTFNGGPTWLVQYLTNGGTFDGDYAC